MRLFPAAILAGEDEIVMSVARWRLAESEAGAVCPLEGEVAATVNGITLHEHYLFRAACNSSESVFAESMSVEFRRDSSSVAASG